MIGLSMILTIALCAVGFTVIYTALDGFTNDFVSSQDNDQDDTPTDVSQITEGIANSTGNGGDAEPESNPGANEEQSEANTEAEPTQAPPPATEPGENADDGFDPDYQVGTVTVNLRSGPSTSTSIVNGLPPATPLQYLGENDVTDGEEWMRFVTEDGQEGWILEVLVTEYEP